MPRAKRLVAQPIRVVGPIRSVGTLEECCQRLAFPARFHNRHRDDCGIRNGARPGGDPCLAVPDGGDQPQTAHRGHVDVVTEPGHYGAGHRLAALIEDRGPELHRLPD